MQRRSFRSRRAGGSAKEPITWERYQQDVSVNTQTLASFLLFDPSIVSTSFATDSDVILLRTRVQAAFEIFVTIPGTAPSHIMHCGVYMATTDAPARLPNLGNVLATQSDWLQFQTETFSNGLGTVMAAGTYLGWRTRAEGAIELDINVKRRLSTNEAIVLAFIDGPFFGGTAGTATVRGSFLVSNLYRRALRK